MCSCHEHLHCINPINPYCMSSIFAILWKNEELTASAQHGCEANNFPVHRSSTLLNDSTKPYTYKSNIHLESYPYHKLLSGFGIFILYLVLNSGPTAARSRQGRRSAHSATPGHTLVRQVRPFVDHNELYNTKCLNFSTLGFVILISRCS